MRISIFQNSNKNIVRISALRVFIASLGLPGIFFGLSVGFLIYYKLPGSPQEVVKKFRAEILTIFLLLFWKIDVFTNSF